jgi:hypothetical protein
MKGLVYLAGLKHGLATALQGASLRNRWKAEDNVHAYVRALSYHSFASGLAGEILLSVETYKDGILIANDLQDIPTLRRLHGDMATTYILAAHSAKAEDAEQYWNEARKCQNRLERLELPKRNHAQYRLRQAMINFGNLKYKEIECSDIMETAIDSNNWIKDLTPFDIKVSKADSFFREMESILSTKEPQIHYDELISKAREIACELESFASR